jgi:hypothetical protein
MPFVIFCTAANIGSYFWLTEAEPYISGKLNFWLNLTSDLLIIPAPSECKLKV